MPNKKPDVSVSIKPVGGSKEDRVYILAGWENDRGLYLLLDRRVKSVVFTMEDGKTITVSRDGDGKATHFFDLYDNREEQKTQSSSFDDFPPEGTR